METTKRQMITNADCRTGASEERTGADENRTEMAVIRTSAANEQRSPAVVNINVNALVLPGRKTSYFNGLFIPVFQDAAEAIARADITLGTHRVLWHMLGHIDEKNCYVTSVMDIAHDLRCSDDTVRRALKQLSDMRIICKKTGSAARSIYELSDKIINPRFAYRGDTRTLNKDPLPLLLMPNGEDLLIPVANLVPDIDF